MAQHNEFSRKEIRNGDNPVDPELSWLLNRERKADNSGLNLAHNEEFQHKRRAYIAKIAAAKAKASKQQRGGRRTRRRHSRRRATRRR
jgi:hypothetical protein